VTMSLSGRVRGLRVNDDGTRQFTLEREGQEGLECLVPPGDDVSWLEEGAEVDIKGEVPLTPLFKVRRGWRHNDIASEDDQPAFADRKQDE